MFLKAFFSFFIISYYLLDTLFYIIHLWYLYFELSLRNENKYITMLTKKHDIIYNIITN